MFTIDHRPRKFDDVVGHKIVKRVLQEVLNDPVKAPKTFMLCGGWGLGKTALAQIFGKAINCISKHKPCFKCDSCINSALYQEMDSSVMGNVATIRELRDSWYYSIGKGYRVIVMDELQVASKSAQANFLKILENPPDNTFFFMLTTDPEDILKPIISRSMVLQFYPLSDEEMRKVIDGVLQKEVKIITEETYKTITRRASGHARDAVMLLEQALIIGESEFVANTLINDTFYEHYFKSCVEQTADYEKYLDELIKSPVAYLKEDLERYILSVLKIVVGEGKSLFDGLLDEKKALTMLQYYVKIKPLLHRSSSDFYSALLGFKTVLKSQDKLKAATIPSRFTKS